MNPVFTQTIYYGITMIITFVFLELLMQGFPHKFIRVFGSLGKLSFIKIRNTTYDAIAIGREDDGFIVFKYHNKEHRLPIPNNEKLFYRFLFCQWIDVDGEKWAISRTDYSSVSGFDPVKIQNFLKRILMQPQIDDNKFKYIYIGFIIIGILLIALIIFDFLILQKLDLSIQLGNDILTKQASVVGATI